MDIRRKAGHCGDAASGGQSPVPQAWPVLPKPAEAGAPTRGRTTNRRSRYSKRPRHLPRARLEANDTRSFRNGWPWLQELPPAAGAGRHPGSRSRAAASCQVASGTSPGGRRLPTSRWDPQRQRWMKQQTARMSLPQRRTGKRARLVPELPWNQRSKTQIPLVTWQAQVRPAEPSWQHSVAAFTTTFWRKHQKRWAQRPVRPGRCKRSAEQRSLGYLLTASSIPGTEP